VNALFNGVLGVFNPGVETPRPRAEALGYGTLGYGTLGYGALGYGTLGYGKRLPETMRNGKR